MISYLTVQGLKGDIFWANEKNKGKKQNETILATKYNFLILRLYI